MPKFVKIFALIAVVMFSATSASLAAYKCEDIDDPAKYSDDVLKQILQACEQEIQENKKVLSEKQQQTQSIKRDLSILQAQIQKNKARLRAKQIEIYRLKQNITNKTQYIQKLNEEIESLKKTLANLLRLKYRMGDYSYVEMMLSKESLSEFFSDIDRVTDLEVKLTTNMQKYQDLKKQALEQKEELAEQVALEKELAEKKEQEIKIINAKKLERDILLARAKKEQEKYEKLIAEKEAIKAKIRNRIFKVASGEKITFGRALDLITPYIHKLNGIDEAFLLAVLFQESGWGGQIGGNIGKCTYNQHNQYGSSKNGKQVMSASQIPAFLQITRALGLDPAKTPVSCPIPSDGAYGGAMGPAQFMPTTWLSVRTQAAAVLGKSPQQLSPFDNLDSFIASGVYLSKLYNSSSCVNYANKYKHIAPYKTLRERCAASMYYAGGNWWKFRFKYGESVVRRANRFRTDIQTLRQ